MSIVLNEYEWAEQMIDRRDLGKKPVETLSRVAKYYLENKYSKKETRRLLDKFVTMCDPSASLVQWSDTLDRVARNAVRFPLVRLDGITVYKSELDKIAELPGKQVRRLAFTLLCVARYWDAVNADNNHWVNSPDRDIMQMANINTSIKRQSMMFSQLRERGMIRFSKKVDNLNVQVTFMDEGGEAALHIDDFRNLGYQYLLFYGGPYFKCENCGLTVKMPQAPNGRRPRGRRQKYCPSCAVELHTRQKVDSVMRHRADAKREQALA